MELSLKERDRMVVMRQASEGVLAVSEAAGAAGGDAARHEASDAAFRARRRRRGDPRVAGPPVETGLIRRRCASGFWRWRRSRRRRFGPS